MFRDSRDPTSVILSFTSSSCFLPWQFPYHISFSKHAMVLKNIHRLLIIILHNVRSIDRPVASQTSQWLFQSSFQSKFDASKSSITLRREILYLKSTKVSLNDIQLKIILETSRYWDELISTCFTLTENEGKYFTDHCQRSIYSWITHSKQ